TYHDVGVGGCSAYHRLRHLSRAACRGVPDHKQSLHGAVGYSAASATSRIASILAPFSTIVPRRPDFAASFHAASRSRMRSGGPHREISSTSLSGTAAAASFFFPSRYRSWIVLASPSKPSLMATSL